MQSNAGCGPVARPRTTTNSRATKRQTPRGARLFTAGASVLPPACCYLRADRHQGDLDAAVLRAAGFGVVAGDRTRLAGTDQDEAVAHQALGHQVVAHRSRATLGQRLVVCVGALAVGMARDFDHGLVVLGKGVGDTIQHRVELRLQVRAVKAERDVLRHVQGDVVALAHAADTGAGHAVAQRTFLAVLVVADRAAGKATDARADQRALTALGGVVAAQQAGHGTGDRADERALLGAVVFVLVLRPLLSAI